jgi:hypothetical protein
MKIFCEEIVGYFKRGVSWFKKEYPADPIINETLFAFQFMKEHPHWVGLFPTMPKDREYQKLGFLIDPDGWGRWVDGCRENPGVPFTAEQYYIGHEILAGNYRVGWSTSIGWSTSRGERVSPPYVLGNKAGEIYFLATLHFNSKRVEKWI